MSRRGPPRVAVVAVVVIQQTTRDEELPALHGGPGWARLMADSHLDAPGDPQPVPHEVSAASLAVQVQFFGVEHGRASLGVWTQDERPTRGEYAAGDTVRVTGGTLGVVAVHDDPVAVDVHLVPDGG